MRRRVGTMVFAANVDASRGSFEPCGPQPRPAEARKRAPQAAPESKPYFVILSEANRQTQRAQRPLADYAEQGGERQTKCSQKSMTNDKESDSSSIFRSPQNDKTER
ncbi:MAG: hypothetical protein K2P46_04060, partial [Alistipes sp.]|nr:hypothetical protein [Alistipes sp.]